MQLSWRGAHNRKCSGEIVSTFLGILLMLAFIYLRAECAVGVITNVWVILIQHYVHSKEKGKKRKRIKKENFLEWFYGACKYIISKRC